MRGYKFATNEQNFTKIYLV